jgi:hypothetical protein
MIISAGPKPAVIQHVALNANRRSAFCKFSKAVQVMIKIDRLPYVEVTGRAVDG